LLAYVGFAFGAAVVIGAVEAWLLGLFEHGYAFEVASRLEAASRTASLEIVGDDGMDVSVWAALFALVTWSHRAETPVVEVGRTSATAVALVAALLGTVVVVPVALLSSSVVLRLAFDVSWFQIRRGCSVVQFDDVTTGLGTHLVSTLASGAVVWWIMPRLSRTPWSLPVKLGVVWIGLVMLRYSLTTVLS